MKSRTGRHSVASFPELLEEIYAAAVEPAAWTSALEDLGDMIGGCASMLRLQYKPAGSRVLAASRWDPDCLRTHGQHYAAPETNPVLAPAVGAPAGSITPVSSYMSRSAYRKTAFYADIAAPQRCAPDGLAVPLVRNDHAVALIGFCPPARKGPFELRDLEFLRKVVPHLARALQVYMRLWELEVQDTAKNELLDQLAHGVAFVDSKRRLVYMNREARRILQDGDGLVTSGEGLGADAPNTNRKLRGLIAQAVSSPERGDAGYGGSLPVSRPSMKRDYQVLVAPFRGMTGVSLSTQPAVIVFITDPARQRVMPKDSLRNLYGLTDAEANLVQCFIEGYGLAETADVLEVSRNTAHTHLTRVFSKTGVSRQAELVRLILQGPPM